MHDIYLTPSDSLQAAIDALPADGAPACIHLAPGEYREKVELRRSNTTLIGSGAEDTVLAWADGATDVHPDGVKRGTFRSYTLLVLADKGYAEAMYTIGNIYSNGKLADDVPDYQLAKEWYLKAAEAGDAAQAPEAE